MTTAMAWAYVSTYAHWLSNSKTTSEARANLHRLIDEVAASYQPLRITGKRHDAVLVSEEDWAAIQETLFLLSVLGMRESILAGLAEPLDACSEDPGWWWDVFARRA